MILSFLIGTELQMSFILKIIKILKNNNKIRKNRIRLILNIIYKNLTDEN